MTSEDLPSYSRATQSQRRPVVYLDDDLDEPLTFQRQVLPSQFLKQTSPRVQDCDSDCSEAPPLPSTPPVGNVNSFKAGGKARTNRKLIPQSWGNFFRKWKKRGHSQQDSSENFLPDGSGGTPPLSPLMDRRNFGEYGAKLDTWGSSVSKELLPPFPDSYTVDYDQETPSVFRDPFEPSADSIHPAEYYAEKMEVYQQKYSYMKSWPGLLRLLAGIELIFGGMVFACVCANIQKDNQWYNLYGYQAQSYSYGGYYGGAGGYNYNGPMTPFVLVVVGLAWLLTVILLVLGLTMYYRTILLDSHWWPLTEFVINLVMFLLYMAAGIVYINDMNRGGMCYVTLGNNPLLSNFCRAEGSQMAGTAFLFINMLMYLISGIVCLKMWRHEADRRHAAVFGYEPPPSPVRSRSKRIVFEDELSHAGRATNQIHFSEKGDNQATLNRSIPTGHIPKPHVIPDYLIKYTEIHSPEDREQYKAVFNDVYPEYKELHADIQAMQRKFTQMDAMMGKLLHNTDNPQEHERIKRVLKEYQKKKNDSVVMEKKERCEYLKEKLSHIKGRIQEFDRKNMGGSAGQSI
ncbi:MARVEL domain-containing protein 2 [Huso huso]|uniref:MARVEL domain-containing protein 2 n=1 Tax=Huso huso TaxID=61971 RepID=A0ABR0Y6R8_HUSHU